MHRDTAPDPPHAGVLGRLQAAIAAWEAEGSAPTSSITGAGAIARLEGSFSAMLAGRRALAVASGTAALRVALDAVGVSPGSEVICPAYDWPASVAAIRSLGAVPVLAPVEARTLTIDPASVPALLGARTRALVATHLFGIPADVPGLRAVLDPADVPVVEDCAQGIGGRIDGQAVGTMGAAGAFSLGPGKLIDAGEGGIVALADDAPYVRALRSSQHPVRQMLAGVDPIRGDGLHQRIHPAAAVLAVFELRTLTERLAAATARAERIHELAAGCPWLCPIALETRRQPNWYRVPVYWDARHAPPPALVLDRPGAAILADGPSATALRPLLGGLCTATLAEENSRAGSSARSDVTHRHHRADGDSAPSPDIAKTMSERSALRATEAHASLDWAAAGILDMAGPSTTRGDEHRPRRICR